MTRCEWRAEGQRPGPLPAGLAKQGSGGGLFSTTPGDLLLSYQLSGSGETFIISACMFGFSPPNQWIHAVPPGARENLPLKFPGKTGDNLVCHLVNWAKR